MSRPERLDALLVQARPPDPSRAASQGAAVRILARLAVREASDGARPPRRRGLRRALAVAAVALLALGVRPHERVRSVGHAPRTEPPAIAGNEVADADPLRALARAAAAGDPLARARLRDRGRDGRTALLDLAAAGGADAARALSVLRSFGALRGPRDVERIAALARRPALRGEAVPLLAADLGSSGAAHLGRLLVDEPDAEPMVVAALERVARRGRRQAALDALMSGVAAGRVSAAALALRLGGAVELRTVVQALPERLRAAPALAEAIARGPRTLRNRTLRLAERGDASALALAARAGLEGSIDLLRTQARSADRATATQAVVLLAEMGSPEAVVALGEARSGVAAEGALAALATSDERALDGVLHRAVTRPREASAALAALGGAGAAGLERLRDLARTPALAPRVIAALASAVDPRASDALLDLGGHAARRLDVMAALATRLTDGDESAGSALLTLARRGHQRAALRALAGCGEPGIRWLREAEREPELRRRARDWLVRLVGAPSRRSSGGPSAI